MLSKVLTLRPQPSLYSWRKQTEDLEKTRATYVCAGQSFHMIILQSLQARDKVTLLLCVQMWHSNT
jgi:hypothetical protein